MNNLLSHSSQVTVSIPIIVAVCVPLFTFVINTFNKAMVEKQNKNINPSALKVKNSPLVIGSLIFLVVLFIVAAVLFPILYLCDIPDGPTFEATLAAALVFGVAAVPCIVFLFALKRWQICVSDEKIVHIPYFKKQREYAWEDIDFVKVNKQDYGNIVYQVFVKQKSKRAFVFTNLMVGGKLLAEELRRRRFIHDWQL